MNRILTPQEMEEQNGNLIDEIIRLSDFSFERLPMLDILGERLAENISIAVPDLTRVICETSLVQLDYVTVAQAVEALPAPAILATCTGEPFDGDILIAMDSTLLMTSLELMLGGEVKELPKRDSADFTTIERGFSRRLARLILDEFQRSLSVVVDSDMECVDIESDPDAVNFAQPASLCVRMKISALMMGHAGALEVLVPYDALEPIRPKLGKIHFGERSNGNDKWHDQLSIQIERAQLGMEAVFAEVTLPIDKILNWKRGETFDLFVEEDQEATIVCAGVPMFRAALGKKNNGNVAIQITEELETKGEFENGRNDH
ncbi:FliM/FliN family flagellar motor switch protein [Shimia sp. CNT1-13L.2]|uniref:flagellar motor switch protein FliM n=1 Tax=Shimia sp. CNT1-13L.2 TaxID=2959663 RepID=UPI0020CC696A|nr:FliM/FliN family flagellar motor switch protein [Shimia sp. CNT1-13L.2]MCP9481079.1 FliM/FliN family flagellar motor switch protein [Shimia sp. CNT1-13L.2]